MVASHLVGTSLFPFAARFVALALDRFGSQAGSLCHGIDFLRVGVLPSRLDKDSSN